MNPILQDRRIWTLALLCVSLVGVGCESGQKTSQVDAYTTENQELRAELDNTQRALEASEQDRARLVAEVADLQGKLDTANTKLASAKAEPAPVAAPAPAPKPNDGFGHIAGVSVENRPGEIAVNVPGDVLFDAGKATLKSSAKRTLSQVADVIRSKHPGKTVRVEGYTDSDPIRKSKWTDNLELSAHRAMAVQRYLKSQGLSEKQMYIAGLGANKPRASKSKSRRVEIVVVN